MNWYLPTLFGDIELHEAPNRKETVLSYEKVSPLEREALQRLVGYSEAAGWGEKLPVRAEQGVVTIKAPIDAVRLKLTHFLKGGGSVLDVVRFADGRISEWTIPAPADAAPEMEEERAIERKKAKPVKGTTVDKPTQGCPAPDFDPVDVRATRVLTEFLTAEQIADWRRHNAIVCTGADTGHDYMVISREARKTLADFGGRSIYDLTEGRSYCVHNWSVPAAEEALGLMLHLVTPGNERYVREIPA